jgi:hypothetical protein
MSAELWKHNPSLDFTAPVSVSTGEILSRKVEAVAGDLRFVLSPTTGGSLACSLVGSLHKYKNGNGCNWDDFTLSELSHTLMVLSQDYSVDLESSYLHSLEVGVNIPLNYSPKRVLKSAICHKGKAFTDINRKDKNIGIICEHEEYTIKLYDKGYQNRINNMYVLRYELKIKRMRVLEQYGIKTLLDLRNPDKVASLLFLLLDKLDEIVFFDFSFNAQSLTDRQRLNWERYSNPKYWEGLNRNMYYKSRKLHAELSTKYGAIQGSKILSEKVVKKWLQLLEIKQETRRQFHRFFEGIESRFKATFSHLECLSEIVATGGKKIPSKFQQDHEQQNEAKNRRFCVSCGRDISHQKKGSRFCSEKELGKAARRCRNKDSNRRLMIKRKLKIAMDKDLMLRITYTDRHGTCFTDTLAVGELNVSREWLDRVVSVEVIKKEPQHPKLEGEKATEYLQTINNQSYE